MTEALDPAPLFDEVACAPAGGRAWWVRAADGVRLRVGAWVPERPRGTVLLFPGRTEYIEKYGPTAGDLGARGYAVMAIDWRGQGLADRLVEDAMSGHVHRFADYQKDVAEMVAAAGAAGMPRPWHLLAHSMGGAIGLRAAMSGLDVASASFTGPMWGIRMAQALRPVAWSLAWGTRQLGVDHLYAPGTDSESYVLSEPFETNKLTTDRGMYDFMIDQLRAHPELALGGPSLRWLHEALIETRDLARRPSPALPCLTLAGDGEEIVDLDRIRARMDAWPGGRLEILDGALHEVLMEGPDTRAAAAEMLAAHYGDAAQPQTGTPAAEGA
ncbi:alpha/beta fold hydrolase [Roseovarius salinarum]|uniref:alpha/beta fold hydrolase n=1 Tax=Roseovarius salinarum TaxID=1981892 RepID=UPI000C34A300|nr:alpha/beta hydrolase [Roseovarius salinarum]